jgi:TPR repeat protein
VRQLLAQFGPYANVDKMLQRACDLGYVASCGSVGRRLADGGERKNRDHAAELLEQACAADAVDWAAGTSHHGGFCHQLHELSKGMKDKPKAAKALERACAQGDKYGCPCKTTSDCGKMPEDQAGDCDCQSGHCGVTGGD